MGVRRKLIRALAAITRHFHPRGTDRILRVAHNPDRRPWSIRGIVRTEVGSRFHVDTKSFIEWSLFFYGAYDPETVAILQAFIRRDMVALDIGANIGTHAIPLGRLAAKVIAFEPQPAVFARLKLNATLNRDSRIEARSMAIADRVGQIRLFIPATVFNPGEATVLEGVGFTESVTVPCTTLDALGIEDVSLIKIDVQGFEMAVFRGARRLLSVQRPTLIFEYSQKEWDVAGQTLDDAQRLLTELGYQRFQFIGRHGLEPLPSRVLRVMNVLAQ